MVVPEKGFWCESTQWLPGPGRDARTMGKEQITVEWGGLAGTNDGHGISPRRRLHTFEEEGKWGDKPMKFRNLARNFHISWKENTNKPSLFIFEDSIGSCFFDFLSKNFLGHVTLL